MWWLNILIIFKPYFFLYELQLVTLLLRNFPVTFWTNLTTQVCIAISPNASLIKQMFIFGKLQVQIECSYVLIGPMSSPECMD